jgi:hypothetical protein
VIIKNREINFYAPTGSIWVSDMGHSCYRDRFNVWIQLVVDGKRYMKHYFVTGEEREKGSCMMFLFDEMKRLWESGPEGAII